jgi:hypothetical protein
MVAQTLVSEVGLDMNRWKTEAHFGLVAGTFPRQPYPRGQGAKPRHSACGQPRRHGTADRGHHPASKPDLPRRAVPTLAQQTWCSESYHGHAAPARPTGLSNVEVRSTVRRQRRSVLRAEKPPTTNRVPQKEGSATRQTIISSNFTGRSVRWYARSDSVLLFLLQTIIPTDFSSQTGVPSAIDNNGVRCCR